MVGSEYPLFGRLSEANFSFLDSEIRITVFSADSTTPPLQQLRANLWPSTQTGQAHIRKMSPFNTNPFHTTN
jgi:hypothetical protein